LKVLIGSENRTRSFKRKKKEAISANSCNNNQNRLCFTDSNFHRNKQTYQAYT